MKKEKDFHGASQTNGDGMVDLVDLVDFTEHWDDRLTTSILKEKRGSHDNLFSFMSWKKWLS